MSGYVKKGYVPDEVDHYILETLMGDAKATISYFSEKTGLTKAPLHTRIKRVWDNYIVGTRALVNKKKLGYDIEGILIISLKVQSNESYQNFICYMHNRPEIRSAELVDGGADFIVRFVSKNHTHTREIINFIRDYPDLCRIQLLNVLEQSIDKPGVPV